MTYLQYLTHAEADQIVRQFDCPTFLPDRQVLWSGLLREEAQQWADKRGMQTLSTVMGPLMRPEHPTCLKSKKTQHGWSNYIKGASILFAQRLAKGKSVVVLCAPPPDKFYPSGQTNYQTLEEPILMGRLGSHAVSRIDMCHPTISEAEEYYYEAWPNDDTYKWVERYGTLVCKRRDWRKIRSKATIATRDLSIPQNTGVREPDWATAGRDVQPLQQHIKGKQQPLCESDTAPRGEEHDEAHKRVKKKKIESVPSNLVSQKVEVTTEKLKKAKARANVAKKEAMVAVRKANKARKKADKAKKKTKKSNRKAKNAEQKVIKGKQKIKIADDQAAR